MAHLILIHLASVPGSLGKMESTLKTWIVPIAGVGIILGAIAWIGGGWTGNSEASARGLKAAAVCGAAVLVAFSASAIIALFKSWAA